MIIDKLLYCLATYLVAAIPVGLLVVKATHGVDIRTVGSGNTGATNVKRVAGNKWAACVLLLDFLKGLIPVVVAQQLFADDMWLPVIVALTAVLAHSKSVYIRFAGGKSAATGLGCFFGLSPWPVALAVAIIAFATMKITKYVSVGSLTAAIVAPCLLLATGAGWPVITYTTLAGLYVIVLHKANIQRLLTGTENRLSP
jgi:acyl phosphate:glycerol-3-phosphate acyltransferase